MASGQTLIWADAAAGHGPTTNYAPYWENSRGEPRRRMDPSTDQVHQYNVFLARHYASGGLTITAEFEAETATSGNVVVTCSIERDNSGSSQATDSYATAKSSTVANPGSANTRFQATFTFANGSEMDSLASGEWGRIQFTRDADNGSDTMAGNVLFAGFEAKET